MANRVGRLCTAVAIVAGLAVAGCGGSGNQGNGSSGTTPTTTPPRTSADPPGTPTRAVPPGVVPSDGAPPGTGPPAGDDGLAWVPFGPADANNPDGSGWYRNMEKRDCDSVRTAGEGLQGGDPLVLALAAVCAAAVHKDQTQWTVAREHAQRVTSSPSSCLEQAGAALLARALAWHGRNPGRHPVLSFPAAGDPVACAFEIVSVKVVDDLNKPTGGPLQGPIGGGTNLVIEGRGLSEPDEVLIGDQPATITASGINVLESVYVTTRAATRPGPARIRLRNRAGEVVAPVTFEYLPATASPSTSDVPPSPSSSDAPSTSDPPAPAPAPPAPSESDQTVPDQTVPDQAEPEQPEPESAQSP